MSNEGCVCLYEIENDLKRTQHCFMPCEAQLQILQERRSLSYKLRDKAEEMYNLLCDVQSGGSPQTFDEIRSFIESLKQTV